MAIDAVGLCVSFRYKTGLESFHTSVRLVFYYKNPFAFDSSLSMWEIRDIPRVVLL